MDNLLSGTDLLLALSAAGRAGVLSRSEDLAQNSRPIAHSNQRHTAAVSTLPVGLRGGFRQHSGPGRASLWGIAWSAAGRAAGAACYGCKTTGSAGPHVVWRDKENSTLQDVGDRRVGQRIEDSAFILYFAILQSKDRRQDLVQQRNMGNFCIETYIGQN